MASVSSPQDDESVTGFDDADLVTQRKLTSTVWLYFKKQKKINGESVAICNHCNASLAGDGGTSHLRKHLKRKHSELIDDSESISTTTYKFDQQRSRKDLGTMVVKHNYPLSIVKHKWFQKFAHGLNPNFNIISRNTLRSDIIDIHKEEKKKMYDFFENISCKVTLTTDLWTSDHQNIAYACLTAHYIDDNWEIKKKILAYRYIEYPHDGTTLYKFMRELILEWNLDKKLFAMVVDNASSNDVMVRLFKSWLKENSLLSLNGDLFHVRCSAHILNLIVQDGIKVIQGLVEKIRQTVRYLKTSTIAQQKFNTAVNHLKLGNKKLPMDVPNRWNSTYLMLEVAISMKDALARLALLDRNYINNPSVDEWEVATTIKDCLAIFYDATKHFSGSNFPTSNLFFSDVCDLQLKLSEWERSVDGVLREVAGPMRVKFEKYWDQCSLVLALAVVFDPQFKMKIVNYYYEKIYGDAAETYVDRVEDAYYALYEEYNKTIVGEIHDRRVLGNKVRSHDRFSGFDAWCEKGESQGGHEKSKFKSEAAVYLLDPLLPRDNDFCVLQWWKINASRYPVLAKIARDILAVPATTIASESAFSVGGRIIDETRASMRSELVEALVTTQDWIEEI